MNKKGAHTTTKKNSTKGISIFEEVINATPDVTGKYQKGLAALGSYSIKIEVEDSQLIDGSLDIDNTVKKLYPEDARWDYAVSYNGKVYFVEVHPAMTSEVTKILAKLAWLKQWLKQQAPLMDEIKAEVPYHWVQVSNCTILPTSPQYRRLAAAGLLPKRKCKLPVQ